MPEQTPWYRNSDYWFATLVFLILLCLAVIAANQGYELIRKFLP